MRQILVAMLLIGALPAASAQAQSVSRTTVSESAGVARVTISLPQAAAQPVDIAWQTGPPRFLADAPSALAGSDYVPASGTLTFAPGETAKEVAVTVLDDALDENGALLRGLRRARSVERRPRRDHRRRPRPGPVDRRRHRPRARAHRHAAPHAPGREPARMDALDVDRAGRAGHVALTSAETATAFDVALPADDFVDGPDQRFDVRIEPLAPNNPWAGATGDAPADGVATVTILDDDPAGPPVTARSGTVRLQRPGTASQRLTVPTSAPAGTRVDARGGVAELSGARLSKGVFVVRSGTEITTRKLTVSAAPGLTVRGRRASSRAIGGPARWTIADGRRGTTVRVLSGRVRVAGQTLRRGQRLTR